MRIHVKVKPGQRADALYRLPDGSLLAHIRAAPKDGEANAYLIRYLADRLTVAKSLVRVEKGFTSPHKTIAIDASDPAVLNRALAAIPEYPQPQLF